ncbi:hypothetical protein ACFVYV_09350 [Streptomyces mirabilis]|uniref:hypothetical protein n=1 Tax=Streptomyces mirabilis TaxID=68239 RepID=UPI0036DD0845
MNPINYARGLVDEFDGCQRTGDKAREAVVREQLAWVAGELDKVAPEGLSATVRALYEEAKAATAEALASKPKRAVKATE